MRLEKRFFILIFLIRFFDSVPLAVSGIAAMQYQYLQYQTWPVDKRGAVSRENKIVSNRQPM